MYHWPIKAGGRAVDVMAPQMYDQVLGRNTFCGDNCPSAGVVIMQLVGLCSESLLGSAHCVGGLWICQ